MGTASTELLAFDGPFSVAMWFKVSSVTEQWQALIAKGDDAWRLHFNEEQQLAFGAQSTDAPPDVSTEVNVNDGRWHLAVIVFATWEEGYQKQIYVDGELAVTEEVPSSVGAGDYPVFLGENSEQTGRNFHGLIDEVAIFSRVFSPEEVQAMYEAGNPYADQQ